MADLYLLRTNLYSSLHVTFFMGSPLCYNHCRSAFRLSRLRPLISSLYQGIAGFFFIVLVFSGAWSSMMNVISERPKQQFGLLWGSNGNLTNFTVARGRHKCRRLGVKGGINRWESFHKNSKPWDSGSDLSNQAEIWEALQQHRCRDACQISERYNQYDTQSRGFETSRYFVARCLTA